MRSQLFRQIFDPLNSRSEKFRADFAHLASLDEEKLIAIATSMKVLLRVRSRFDSKAFYENLQSRIGLAPMEALPALLVFDYLIRQLTKDECRDDSPEEVAADLVELGLVTAAQVPKIEKALSLLIEERDDFKSILVEHRSRFGITPSLADMEYTVELRGAFSESFEFGDDLEAYEPRFQGVVPIVSIQLSLDSGSPSELSFSCDEVQLQWMLETIRAAQVDLSILKSKAVSENSDQEKEG